MSSPEIVSPKDPIISADRIIGRERVIEDNVQIWNWLSMLPSQHTRRAYERILRDFFSFHSKIGIDEVETQHIVQFFTHKLGAASEATKNLNRSALASFFRHLIVADCDPSNYRTRKPRIGNPVLPIKTSKVSGHFSQNVPPYEVITKIIDTESNIRNRLMLKFAFALGVRLFGLQQIRVDGFKTDYNAQVFHMIMGKRKKMQQLFVPVDLWLEIREYVRLFALTDDNYLFSTDKNRNRPMSSSQIFRIFEQAGSNAGICPSPNPHKYRHGHAIAILENGGSLRQVQQSLGHASIATTQIYIEGAVSEPAAIFLENSLRANPKVVCHFLLQPLGSED